MSTPFTMEAVGAMLGLPAVEPSPAERGTAVHERIEHAMRAPATPALATALHTLDRQIAYLNEALRDARVRGGVIRTPLAIHIQWKSELVDLRRVREWLAGFIDGGTEA